MNAIRCLIHQKAVYFIGFLTLIVLAMALVCSNSKIGCFIQLNSLHTKWLDIIFINLTFLGDGLFSIIAALLVLIIGKLRRLSIHIVIAYLLSGIAAQILKRIFMAPRPKEIIESSLYKSFLDGITGVGWDSFPSGHTTSIFALATILALHVNKKSWGLFFLILAMLVGYSRIYLGQHFLQDVMAGAILGTCIGVIVYVFVNFRKGIVNKKTPSKHLQEESVYSTTFAGN